MRLALDEALKNVDAFWDTQMTAYNLKVEKSKSAMVARHAEERQELKHKLVGPSIRFPKVKPPPFVCFVSHHQQLTVCSNAFASVEPEVDRMHTCCEWTPLRAGERAGQAPSEQ